METIKTLRNKGFESYLVGGCVRDLILGNKPHDWDITTNATPEQIIELFPEHFYENDFGTVGVKNTDENEVDESLKVIEVTPYRIEGEYSDFRRPDTVTWGKTIGEDLSRRDFKMNAIAYDPIKDITVDPYSGVKDIKDKLISCVGNPDERFKEDALRMLRAVRFSAQLGFLIDPTTASAIKEHGELLGKISQERIRDEFIKIIETKWPMDAIIVLHNLGILKYISREIEEGVHVKQNQAHKYDVWEHNLRSMQHAVDKGWPLHMRLAGLFHDVAKPRTALFSKEKNDWTFYGHDVVGGRVTREIMDRLKFP